MITGRVLRTEESTDGRKNIRVVVEFAKDGKVIIPEWCLLARYENFVGRTSDEILGWIRVNIESQIESLIVANAKTTLNTEYLVAIEQLKASAVVEKDSAIIQISANENISEPYTVTIKDDGTYTTDRIAEK